MVRMTRRGEKEMKVDILRACSRFPRKPTWVMYDTNMSYKSLRKKIAPLIQNGLIETIPIEEYNRRCNTWRGWKEINDGRVKFLWFTTPEGKEVLKCSNKMEGLLNEKS